MRTVNNGLWKVSLVVSVLGHPLLTATVFILFVAFTRFSGVKAVVSSLIVIGLVILPIIAWNYRNTRKGRYSNFDVSVRSQRHSFYGVSIVLLGLGTLAMWMTDQPPALRCGMAFALLLVVVRALPTGTSKLRCTRRCPCSCRWRCSPFTRGPGPFCSAFRPWWRVPGGC
jgi:hypothetical protein